MANEKSIVKIHRCRTCRAKKYDHTGKQKITCCGELMQMSDAWGVRLTVRGKTKYYPVSTRKQEAVDFLHAAKDAQRRGALMPGEEATIDWEDAAEEFEKWVESPTTGLAPKTQEFYKCCLAHLNKHFTGSTLQGITVRQVEQYRDGRTASPKTISEEIKTLKRIYSLHCRWHSARVAPSLHAVAADLSNVEMPKVSNKRTRFLTEKEIELLLSKCRLPHLKLAVTISLRTGLRHGNVMGLQYRQIDFERGTITFSGDTMKSGRTFVLPVMQSVLDDIKAWRKGQKKLNPYLFPCPRFGGKKPMTDMQTSWEEAVKAAKLKDVCWHSLRHTYASHFLMNGGDLSTLSELLDHSSIQVTKDRYGHLSGEHKKKAVDAFEGAMGWGMI